MDDDAITIYRDGPELLFIASNGEVHDIDRNGWTPDRLEERDRAVFRALLALVNDHSAGAPNATT